MNGGTDRQAVLSHFHYGLSSTLCHLYTCVTRPLSVMIEPDPDRNSRPPLAPSCILFKKGNHERQI